MIIKKPNGYGSTALDAAAFWGGSLQARWTKRGVRHAGPDLVLSIGEQGRM